MNIIRTCAVLFSLTCSFSAHSQALDIFTEREFQDILETAIGCELTRTIEADMTVAPLFSIGDSGCESVLPGNSGVYYADSRCELGIEFRSTGRFEYCAEVTDRNSLGEGGSEDFRWTLPPGTRYDIGAASLESLSQPYRTSVIYRTISTDAGECQLLMRIYKSDLKTSTPLRALLAIHGGSWRSRGFGAIGIESTVAHYTNQGFVVFAPFYRLLGNREGSAACHYSTLPDIADDITASLRWLEVNAAGFGAYGKPVVFGQSAGAHLALTLAVNEPTSVAAAVLLYPPTDFTDFLQQVRSGDYSNEQGIGLMNLVLGDARQVDLMQSPVPQNSFPSLINQRSDSYPPMQIVHGLADELVPARQSIRLCNALAGRALDEPLVINDELQQQTDCGPGSTLTMYKEGQHALDICLSGDPLLSSICPSGSAQSRLLIGTQMQAVANWAANTGVSNSGGGAVTQYWLFLFLCWLVQVRRKRGVDQSQCI